MPGTHAPETYMAQQRNTSSYYHRPYDHRVPLYEPNNSNNNNTYNRVGDSFLDGGLTSTSGSSSSASHNVPQSTMLSHSSTNWAPPPSNAAMHPPSTPPRINNNNNNWPVDNNAATLHHHQHQGNSTSRFTDARNRTGVNPPVHYRTNFGKNRGYFPPATKSSPSRVPPETPVVARRDVLPSPQRLPPDVLEKVARARAIVLNEAPTTGTHESGGAYNNPGAGFMGSRVGNVYGNVSNISSPWEEDDMPFDQQRDMYRQQPIPNYHQTPGNVRYFDDSMETYQDTPPRTSQSDWEQSSPNRPMPLRTYHSEPDESVAGRFQISPPRMTDPTPLPFQPKSDMDVIGPGGEPSYPPTTTTTTSSHYAPADRFHGRPIGVGDTGYDSMEAECSPNRTHESTSLYSPFSQTTRGSQFKWPDDSPKSKATTQGSPSSRPKDAPSLHSPARSLHSAKEQDSFRFDATVQPEIQVNRPVDDVGSTHSRRSVNDVPVEVENSSRYDVDEPEVLGPLSPGPLLASHLSGVPGHNYPSLVTVSQETDSQDDSSVEHSLGPEPQVDDVESVSEPYDSKVAPVPAIPVQKTTFGDQSEVDELYDEESSRAGDHLNPEEELPASSAHEEVSPRSMRTRNSLQTDDDSIFVFTDDDQPAKPLSPSDMGVSPNQGQPRKKGQPTQRRGRRRVGNELEGDEDDDDTSLDNDYGVARKRPSSLQERAQQAWASRKNAAHRSLSSPVKRASVVPTATVETPSPTRLHDEDEITALTGATGDPSFTGSLNSLYTKTLESEVEDAIKDLLLIGTGRATNPGRRPTKFQPGVKRNLKQQDGEENSTSALEEEATDFTPLDDETDLDETLQDEKKEADNPIKMMWEYMEGNLSVLGSAFGLSPEAKAETKSKPKNLDRGSSSTDEGSSFSLQKSERAAKMKTLKTPQSYDYGEETERSKRYAQLQSTDRSVPSQNSEMDKSKRRVDNQLGEKIVQMSDGETRKRHVRNNQLEDKVMQARQSDSLWEDSVQVPEPIIVVHAREIVEEIDEIDESSLVETVTYSVQALTVSDSLGSDNADASAHSLPMVRPAGSPTDTAPTTPTWASRSTKLEEDPRLIELALEAARSFHQLAGVEFDDSGGLDIVEEIKFSIVKLPLPLGILFQENYGGCWVTRILPSGNAAKVGGVELGDQLAAVNGVSAIRAKVDEVCTLVSEAPDPSLVELTFLRYVGPLRSLPGVPEEEEEEELPVVVHDELKQRDYCQTENVFSCVIGTIKEESSAHTEPDETVASEEKPRQELSELQPSAMASPQKTNAKKKVSEGKRRFRFFGLGRKKQAASK